MTATPTKQSLDLSVKTTPYITGTVKPKVPSEEALKVLNLKPVPTVWGWETGKPIYERLPAISQQYQLGYDYDQAYAYIEPQFGTMVGPGSLQPVLDIDDFSILNVNTGVITFKYGNVETVPLNINVTTLNNGRGLEDGEYQVGFLLTYGEDTSLSAVLGFDLAKGVDTLLSDAAIHFNASEETFEHPDFYALNDLVSQTWWPIKTTLAGPYETGSWFALDFRIPVVAEDFRVVADSATTPEAKLGLYYSNDAIIWYKSDQVNPIDGEWNAQALSPTAAHRYWRTFFWDGSASIAQIYYTGEAFFPDNRPLGKWAKATPYVDSLYEQQEGDYYLVASFTVKNDLITQLTDQRRVIDRKYEPVSEWLTSFQDLRLRCLFEDVEHYAERYLAPPTSDFNFYQDLDNSTCNGKGPIDVDNWKSTDIDFPIEVALASNFVGNISPNQIWGVGYFTVESDLASKLSTNTRLNDWSIDNGLY